MYHNINAYEILLPLPSTVQLFQQVLKKAQQNTYFLNRNSPADTAMGRCAE